MEITTISDIDLEAVERANATGSAARRLHPRPLAAAEQLEPLGGAVRGSRLHRAHAGWPDDPETVEEANANPDVFAGKTVGQVADHYDAIIRELEQKPAVIGHSFGGLLTQIVAGRGLSAVSVVIDSAPFRGVLPLPITALRSAAPVLHNPANRHKAVPLTFDQFRYGFANAVSEEEAEQLYKEFAVPASGAPLFQAATANLNPWTEAKADSTNPERGPMLIVSGQKDNTAPHAIVEAIYNQQKKTSTTRPSSSSWRTAAMP